MLSKIKHIIKKLVNKNNFNNNNMVKIEKTIENTKIKKYSTLEIIGEGGHSIIKKIKDKEGNLFICKEFKYKDKRNANREYNILKKINKSNLFNPNDYPLLVDYISENEKIKVITEYDKNSEDLFDWVYKRKLSDKVVKEVFLEMVRLTNNLHEIGFIHLDIKLENFLIIKKNPIKLKMIDFDMSHSFTNKKTAISRIIGTRGYSPIEFYNGFYSYKSDAWSLGVCLWVLLTGKKPFNHKNIERFSDKQLTNVLLESNIFKFPSLYHTGFKVDPNAFNLIERLLVNDIDSRPELKEILQDKWFK